MYTAACVVQCSLMCGDVCVKPMTLHGPAHAHMDECENSRPSTICWCMLPSRKSSSKPQCEECGEGVTSNDVAMEDNPAYESVNLLQ